MLDSDKTPGRRRPGKNVFTTKSGNTIKLNRSLSDRIKANREAKARKRAAYLSTLPKNRFKRILYLLHPKRQFKYWFSREGGIMALKIAGIGIVAGFLLLVGIFAYFRKDLPNIKDISGDELGGSITYYDRTGQTVLWQDYDAVKRVPVSGENISPYVKKATIAIEDKNYYKHGAFDVQGITRAAVHNFTGGGAVEGGSTITQQLVKLTRNWTEDRSIARKLKELILAVELEREYSKEDILTGYLNVAPYGNVQYGVETASQDFFGKSAKDLTLAEAAMLAAIPKSPSKYGPTGIYYKPDALVGRQQYIIDQMYKQKMISKTEADAAKSVDIIASIRPVKAKYSGIRAPYFVLAAKDELEDKYGGKTVQRGGWKVVTTLDMKLQDLAEQQVAKGIVQVKKQKGDSAAFAAIDVHTAQMVALVGGADFSNPEYGQVNFAKQPLPPGSSFKPYDYAAFINESDNVGAGSVLYDSQGALPQYPCTDTRTPDAQGKNGGNCLHDYDRRYPGPVTIRYGLGGSRNVTAVKAMLSTVPNNTTASVNKTIATAEALGLVKNGYKCYADEKKTKETQCYGSSAIGDGAYLHLDEHVNGYASLSRLGAYIPETYILKIIDAQGDTLLDWKQPKAKQVIKQESAYIIDDILSDPNASYLRADRKFHRYKDWHFGIKTGTTNSGKDGWMMSMSTQYAVGVWVGHHTGNVEMSGAMENMTQPLIQGWMQGAHKDLKAVNWVAPAGIQKLPAFVLTGKISAQAEVVPSPKEDIFPSWYKPPKNSGSGGNQAIDIVSNKAATSCTPNLARKSEGSAAANVFSVDLFYGKTSNTPGANTTETDNVHICSDAKPDLTLTAPDTCTLNCVFTVTVTQGTHPLSSDTYPGVVNLLIDGQKVDAKGVSSSPSTVTFNYSPTTSGTITVQAQVVDSVLYDTSESATVTVGGI